MFGQGAAGTGGSSGGAPSEDGAGVRRPLAIGAAMGVAALTGVVAFFLLRRRGQRMAKPSAGPILVATFGSTTEWVGRTIVQEGGVFVLEGHGRVSAADVMSYDRDGHLVWPSEGSRAWVGSQAGAGSAPTAQSR
jgi:hypothetical protein